MDDVLEAYDDYVVECRTRGLVPLRLGEAWRRHFAEVLIDNITAWGEHPDA